jgi:OOP family OmpA-OmpF porin
MNRVAKATIGVVTALAVAGCAVTRENQNACIVGSTVLGAVIVGGAAGAGVAEGTDDGRAGAGAGGGGAVLGGALGYLLGRHFCQVAEAAPTPPPPPPPPAPAPRKIATLTGPNFDFNKSTLTASGRKLVDHAIQVLKSEPNTNVSVEGHTDAVGTDAYNMKLSQHRADAVREYMVAHGISESRITTKGWGKTKPVATNDTAAGRAQNRRVEIIAQ